MSTEMQTTNSSDKPDAAMYLANNYVMPVDYLRNSCTQQYHPPQPEFNLDHRKSEKNCEKDSCNEERPNSSNNMHYNVVSRINIEHNNDDYATEWGASTSSSTDTTAKDSTISSEILSDKQSSPESNISPTSTSSSPSSTAIQTSSGTVSEMSGSSTSSAPLQEVIPTCIYILSRIAIYLEIEHTASATVSDMMTAVLSSDELALNKTLAESLFTLWMCSPLLELQLKPAHKPVQIRKTWYYLLGQYSQCSSIQQTRDEPKIILKRNIFCPRQYEERIKDQKILELLYVEAKYNVLEGRYPCEAHHCITLGGIQARIELGPYNPQIHTINFFREQQWKYLPAHIRKSSNWIWLPISSKNSAEVRLLEQFKRIPQSATNKKLIRKYLEFCWSLPFYGAAFLHGQVEQPVRGLTSLMIHQDIPILVAVNSDGVYIIDDTQGHLLLGLKYEELSWEYARPSREDNKDCLPCIFIQFMVLENGTQVSKILQIFSRQAQMIDTLITANVEKLKKKVSNSSEMINRSLNTLNSDTGVHTTTISMYNGGRRDIQQACLSNKLNKLVLSTFDEEGRCIGKMGSWSFSY